VIGGLMFLESVRTMFKKPVAGAGKRQKRQRGWMHKLPFKMRFRKSKLYISAILPLLVGWMVGVLVAIMGVGGGFVMVPAMIYLLGMPTQVVVGTSLFQIIFVTANTTILQSWFNQTVDVVLALLLLAGGVLGAQIGARLVTRLKGEQLRVLLALLVLSVGIKLAVDLVTPPVELYVLDIESGAS
jgi:uncharacterized membrane protein YfcA